LTRPSRAVWLVAGAAALFCATYVFLNVNALHALRANQNTGLYLQTLVRFLHDGSTFNYADGRPHQSVHNQWIIFAIAPLVALWPRPETMIVVGVAALASAAIPLYFFTRACGAGERVATLYACAYLLAPSTQGWAYVNGFVPESCIPLLAFSLALAIRLRSATATVACALLLCGVKEDLGLFVAWFGAFVALWWSRPLGLASAGIGLCTYASYALYAHAAGFVPERPDYAFTDREVPQQLAFFVETLVPVGFAPIGLGLRALAAAPALIEIFFAQHHYVAMYRAGSYYTTTYVTIAVIGGAIAVSKEPRFANAAFAGAVVMALFFNTTVLHIGRALYQADPQYAVARRWALVHEPVYFPCADESAWVVASANTNAKLGSCVAPPEPPAPPRAAWHNVPLNSHAAWTLGPPAESTP
jgi:uncharacterized membrane protein